MVAAEVVAEGPAEIFKGADKEEEVLSEADIEVAVEDIILTEAEVK
jgi:hypothetical protein